MRGQSRILVSLTFLPLTGVLAASCMTVGRAPVDRSLRYKVVLDHMASGTGPGANTRRLVHVEADAVERITAGRQQTVTVQGVSATGDEVAAASARNLEGAVVTVGLETGEVAFGGRRLTTPLSTVADALLLPQPPASAERAESGSGLFDLFGKGSTTLPRLSLPTDGGTIRLFSRQERGEDAQHGGEPARTFSVTSGASTAMTVSAFRASSDGSNLYVAQPPLLDLIGPMPNQPFDTAVRGPVRRQPGFRGFCLFTCESPPRARPRAGPGQEIVVVKGPQTLEVGMSGSVDVTSSGVVDRTGKRVLRSTTTGRSRLAGTLPSGPGVPPELERQELQVESTWTVSKTLLPEPSDSPGRPTALGLGLALLLAVSVATGATARRLRRR